MMSIGVLGTAPHNSGNHGPSSLYIKANDPD